ncbi:hypothetical protein [Actinokineospora pegani]|uniref:hypothetical protein n=1 Tax=Actinokineospora pegani TaxID=2654637 RepID=UPI0012EAB564|nr:hypothetical protein [Actinokineospora pegani]
MRPLVLYLRSRQVPLALPGSLLAVVAVVMTSAGALNPQRQVITACLAVAAGLAVLGQGFGGVDPELDRTAAVRWPPLRMVHAGVAAVLVGGVTVMVSTAPAGVVLRAALGFVGLAALAAALFGRQLAWTLPVAWALPGVVMPPMSEPLVVAVLTWPVQPQDSTPALLAAVVLGVGGLAVHAVRGTP